MSPKYSSMWICTCSSCSSKTHFSPYEEQSGVTFAPYQYAQHIQKKWSFLNSQLSTAPQANQSIPVQSTSTVINFDDLLTQEIPNVPYEPPSNVNHFDTSPWNPYQLNQQASPQSLARSISAMLSVNCKISHKASCILNPDFNLLMKNSIGHCGETFDSKLNIPSEAKNIFTQFGLDPTLEVYVSFPHCFFLNGLSHTVMDPSLQCKRHQQPYNNHPPCNVPLGHMIDL
ncbi:hypothetical protein O181_061478 [Austropuccinia psidii MF-1]|uniref:Uncharacterized protein n=1 Tax=Austropuccinia psidii MF-1 TaxID=1389203 RepID=A0A9Q3EI48_9BASI|nr:hypothetical protein [Austropuccinia psidii MF-1]